MKRVFYDSDPIYNCTRIETSLLDGTFPELPKTASDVRIVEDADIPTDRTFRNAWRPDFTIDMQKAREVVRSRIRHARTPILEALDKDYMRALEAGDTARCLEIVAKKQALRDAPANPAIEAAQTPDELKALPIPQ